MSRAVCIFAILIVCLVIPSVAHAAFRDGTDIAARCAASIGTQAGVAGTNYVMQDPQVTYQHVSSIYVWQETSDGSPDYMVESGWVVEPPTFGDRKTTYFYAWIQNGYYYTRPGAGDQRTILAAGTNHRYSMRPSSVGSNVWKFFLDGELQHQRINGLVKGTPLATSERNGYPEDTNYGHFWDLKKCSAVSGDWYPWKDLQLWLDNDPGYKMQKSSDTECYFVAG